MQLRCVYHKNNDLARYDKDHLDRPFDLSTLARYQDVARKKQIGVVFGVIEGGVEESTQQLNRKRGPWDR